MKKWLLEIDEAGLPSREIGLAEDGTPLFTARNRRNMGVWTDTPYRFMLTEGKPVEPAYFEELWRQTSK